jgi:hypothetical protein
MLFYSAEIPANRNKIAPLPHRKLHPVKLQSAEELKVKFPKKKWLND